MSLFFIIVLNVFTHKSFSLDVFVQSNNSFFRVLSRAIKIRLTYLQIQLKCINPCNPWHLSILTNTKSKKLNYFDQPSSFYPEKSWTNFGVLGQDSLPLKLVSTPPKKPSFSSFNPQHFNLQPSVEEIAYRQGSRLFPSSNTADSKH